VEKEKVLDAKGQQLCTEARGPIKKPHKFLLVNTTRASSEKKKLKKEPLKKKKFRKN